MLYACVQKLMWERESEKTGIWSWCKRGPARRPTYSAYTPTPTPCHLDGLVMWLLLRAGLLLGLFYSVGRPGLYWTREARPLPSPLRPHSHRRIIGPVFPGSGPWERRDDGLCGLAFWSVVLFGPECSMQGEMLQLTSSLADTWAYLVCYFIQVYRYRYRYRYS